MEPPPPNKPSDRPMASDAMYARMIMGAKVVVWIQQQLLSHHRLMMASKHFRLIAKEI
jgi:hypothetical protein